MPRTALLILAAVSPFFFPWQFSLALIFAAALFMPAMAVALGVLFDLLYYTPNLARFPYATIVGILGALVVIIVQRFWKTRIIGG